MTCLSNYETSVRTLTCSMKNNATTAMEQSVIARTKSRLRACCLMAAGLLVLLPPHAQSQPPSVLRADDAGYRQTALPFFKQHCLSCHGPDDQQADLRVDQHLPNDFLDLVTKGKWGEVVNVLNSHEMPPEDEPQPKPEEVAKVVDWITHQMVNAELHRRDSAIVVRRMCSSPCLAHASELLSVIWLRSM